MKLLYIATKDGYVVFKDLNTNYFHRRKVIHHVILFNYFVYKRRKIFISEFVPQRDGTLLYFRE